MRDLKLIVKGQALKADPDCDFSGLIRGTNNYVRLNFSFDSEWYGMSKAVQVSDISGNVIVEPLSGNVFMVPKQVTGDSIMKVKLFGMKKTEEYISTNEIHIKQN